MTLKIQLTCPAPAGSTLGNRVTALRWARILRELGHRARITGELQGNPDMLVALHARKSAAAAAEFKRRFPARPLIVALTGTDLYGDLPAGNRAALASLKLADSLVVLHAGARAALPAEFRRKTTVIHQSVKLPSGLGSPGTHYFDVCVLAHLRAVKDPLRAAMAARKAPLESKLRIRHLGAALEQSLLKRAQKEQARNSRYHWLGERRRSEALKILSSSHLLVLSSRMEGGANAIGEAAALGVPVLASDIAGNRGLLGAKFPGYFEFGDTDALAELLQRAEQEPAFYRRLQAHSKRISVLFTPEKEHRSWKTLCSKIL